MKKTYGVSKKTKGAFGYCKHLRKYGKRRANKDTRKMLEQIDKNIQAIVDF